MFIPELVWSLRRYFNTIVFFHEFQHICAMVAWFAELNHATSWTFMRLPSEQCQNISRVTRSWSVGCFAPAWTVAPGLQGLVRMVQNDGVRIESGQSEGSKVRPVSGICWDHHPLDFLKRKPFPSRGFGFPSVWKSLVHTLNPLVYIGLPSIYKWPFYGCSHFFRRPVPGPRQLFLRWNASSQRTLRSPYSHGFLFQAFERSMAHKKLTH